jgi:glutathione S-transferase
MFRLYGAYRSASLAPQMMLEEVGAKYEFVLVDISGDKRDPEYLKLNPHGRVPTLVHDGRAMFESAAICQYVADLHPKAGLAPAWNEPGRSLYLQWLTYLTNTQQEAILEYFYADRYSTDPADAPRVKAKAAQKLDEALNVIDRGLRAKPYLAGDKCSAADLFLQMVTGPGWHPGDMKPISEYRNIARNRELVAARPAVQRTYKANQVD